MGIKIRAEWGNKLVKPTKLKKGKVHQSGKCSLPSLLKFFRTWFILLFRTFCAFTTSLNLNSKIPNKIKRQRLATLILSYLKRNTYVSMNMNSRGLNIVYVCIYSGLFSLFSYTFWFLQLLWTSGGKYYWPTDENWFSIQSSIADLSPVCPFLPTSLSHLQHGLHH